MSDKQELINVTIYDPRNGLFGNKSDRAECTMFYCSSKDNCSYYAKGQCLNVANIFRGKCAYGSKSVYTGYTPRARKYDKWISDVKEKHASILYALKRAPDVIGEVGDYICLPYTHMSLNDDSFKQASSFFVSGQPFIHKNQWNIDKAYNLITKRPMSMMGGEIKSYKTEVVPKFCKDIQDVMPEFYKELIKKYPDVKSLTESYSYVGRKAILSTLKPGTEIKERDEIWVWDGKQLTSKNKKILFPVVSYDEIVVSMTPKSGESIEITSDDQVDADTEFSD